MYTHLVIQQDTHDICYELFKVKLEPDESTTDVLLTTIPTNHITGAVLKNIQNKINKIVTKNFLPYFSATIASCAYIYFLFSRTF